MGTGVGTGSIPSHRRFDWDAKSPPWTDGRGNQQEYKVAVEDCNEFNDLLPESSPYNVHGLLQRPY